jgi:hypothetical protein
MERTLPLRQRQLHRFRRWENGIMFAKILFVLGLVSTTEDWPFQGEIVEIEQA